MSKITADLLRAMVPKAKGQMIDKLIDPLNLVLPAYGITTEYRVAGFLGTAAPESDWFKTLREYGKGGGHAYGKPDRVTGLVYYGRGIFQNTWKKGYQAFTDYVAAHWASIKARAAIYDYTEAPDFVANPELLATPYWSVEAACWYWKVNGLAAYADRGLKGYFGLQGLVNRGSASKEALDYYEARLPAYEKARRLIPDDFALGSTTAAPNQPAPLAAPDTSETPATDEPQPPSLPSDSPTDDVPTSAPNKTDVVVEKEPEVTDTKPKGFFGPLWQKVTGAVTAAGGTDAAIEKAQQAKTFGLSDRTWDFIFYAIITGLAIWIIYHFVVVKVVPWGKWLLARMRTNQLVAANSTGDSVQVISADKLAEYEAKGYLVIKRS